MSKRFRSGKYVQQPTGYRAFIPEDLPPQPPIFFSETLQRQLSDADRALGRLDAFASIVPNADLFVAMYVRQEAVLSSQIEGTQSTLEDVIQFEVDHLERERPKDVEEVVNYVAAMNYGLQRLQTLPLSLRLIREIHLRLLTGVRGAERSPGEFRTSQNWIGPAGCLLKDAEFVPPPPHEMRDALNSFEAFLQMRGKLPILIHCGLAHAQFETIHPFLDGNGRVGRLLITLLLCEREVLRLPLLYLSYYFKAHRLEYYDRLTAVRNNGDWEGWLSFFLSGVFEVSQGASDTTRAILELRERHRDVIAQKLRASVIGPRLLDYLFTQPIISIKMAQNQIGCTYLTASKLVDEFVRFGILSEITGRKRNRHYRYDEYMRLHDRSILRTAEANE